MRSCSNLRIGGLYVLVGVLVLLLIPLYIKHQNFVRLGRQEILEALHFGGGTDAWRSPTSVPIEFEHDLMKVKGNRAVVFYNRVSRSAGTTVKLVFHDLSRQQVYTAYTSPIHRERKLRTKQQQDLVYEIANMKKPLFYDRQVNFIDFSQMGGTQPVYINVIRDPIQRFVSSYYFVLHLCVTDPKRCPWSGGVLANQTIDDCVFTNKARRCRSPFDTIPYFCGHQDSCMVPGRWSLNRAKENVILHYTVVGLSSDIGAFFKVMEWIFPAYCKNATNLFIRDGKERLENKQLATFYVPPSNKTIDTLKIRMAYEYDFYKFIKQRFYQQYKLITALQ